MWREQAVVFECEGCRLLGIVTIPEQPSSIGVSIVVGGPQYRAGSHRQFTLLARQLAEQNIASIRFDYRGMGDSEGDMRNFEGVNSDIRASLDALLQSVSQVQRVALWGLCDAASAALYYAPTDKRVSNLVLLNPWVHTPAGAAKAQLKYYYLSRLMQRSFWLKLLSGKVRLGDSAKDLKKASQQASDDTKQSVVSDPRHGSAGYVERMYHGLNQFDGKILLLLSGNDLVAKEFIELTKQDKRWGKKIRSKQVQTEHIKDANHTFSTQLWRDKVGQLTANWLNQT